MRGLKILGTASYTPKNRVYNKEFEKSIETSDEWISSRTGIKSRYFANEEESNLYMASEVAHKLVESNNKDDIMGVIVATFTADNNTPSIASIVQKNVGLRNNIFTFDINAACSGFIYGLYIAKGLLLQNPSKKILLIASEKISSFLNFEDRNTCILFGDGAGGVLLELQDENIDKFIFETIGDDETIVCPSHGGKINMNGKEVFSFAINSIIKGIINILDETNLTIDDIDHFVCHQANYRIISHVYKKMKIDSKKFYINLDEYGNTSSASIPIVLNEMNQKSLLNKGDKIILVGFGAGLTWGSSLIRW